MTTATGLREATMLRGAAAAAVRGMGDRVVWSDLYGEQGSRIYDDTGAMDRSEVRELVHLVRPRPGAVLELAAGSGRLTLPLLATGHDVTALELSPHMLSRLEEAAAGTRYARNLVPVRGDMSDFDLGRTYSTVVLGASSITLLHPSQRPGLYTSVRRHLEPGGSWFLSLAEPLGAQDEECDSTHELAGVSGAVYQLHQSWSPGEERRTICVHPVDTGQQQVPVCVSRPYVLTRPDLEDELAAHGLRLVEEHPMSRRTGAVHDVMLEVQL